jgi:hypothetical protein
MSGWENWVDYVHGTAANKYVELPGSNPAVWHISINHMTDGEMWAKSADFDADFKKNELTGMSKAAAGEDSSILGAPPTGFTIVRTVPCDQCDVLCGKSKVIAGRQIFAARSTGAFIIALVDIENSTKGSEAMALNAFAYGVEQAIAQGI